MPDPTDPHPVADDPSGIVQQMPEVGPCGPVPDDVLHHGAWQMADDLEGWFPSHNMARYADMMRDLAFDLRNARATEADLRAEVERLQGMIDAAAGIFANCNVESGICCCGEAMDGHSLPMSSNHSPVDQGNYAVDRWLKAYKSLSTETDGGQDA